MNYLQNLFGALYISFNNLYLKKQVSSHLDAGSPLIWEVCVASAPKFCYLLAIVSNNFSI